MNYDGNINGLAEDFRDFQKKNVADCYGCRNDVDTDEHTTHIIEGDSHYLCEMCLADYCKDDKTWKQNCYANNDSICCENE